MTTPKEQAKKQIADAIGQACAGLMVSHSWAIGSVNKAMRDAQSVLDGFEINEISYHDPKYRGACGGTLGPED